MAGYGSTAPLKVADSVAGLISVFDQATAKSSGKFIRYDGVEQAF
jgi:hypothetical protein